jgi:hypothetical protein
MNQGTIQLVLRGYGDPDSIKTSGATSVDVMAQLGGTPRAAAAAPARTVNRSPRRPAPPPRVAPAPAPVAPRPEPPRAPDSLVVQVFRGDKVTQQKLERPDNSRP